MNKNQQFYCSNIMPLSVLKSLEDAMGKNSVNAVLDRTNLSRYMQKYSTVTLEKNFGFSEFSNIAFTLDELFETYGGHAISLRIGREMFQGFTQRFRGLFIGIHLMLAVLPARTKIKVGLSIFAKICATLSDQKIAIEQNDTEWIWVVDTCPYCWEHTGLDRPACTMVVGFLQEGMKWISGGKEFNVVETRCMAAGDYDCTFVIQKNAMG